MKKNIEMILPADISYAIWITAAHSFYDDDMPIEPGTIEDIAFFENCLLQWGIEQNLVAFDLDIDGWLKTVSNAKKIAAGSNPELYFNLRLPNDLSIAVKTIQLMTGMDLWQILWIGTSKCMEKLFTEDMEAYYTNLTQIIIYLMDEDCPFDIDTITLADLE